MNLITVSSLCLLLLASGALATDLSQYGTKGRIRGLKTGPKPPPPSKKMSSKGGMDRPVHPTPSPPATECQIFGVTFYRDDIPDYFKEAEVTPGILVGGLNKIPFYDTASGDQLGTYTDGGVRYGTNSSDECVGTAAFNFDPLNDEGFASSQINLQFTCSGESNAITGGTGDYKCATGYEDFTTVDDKVVSANLVVCLGDCPSADRLRL